jgi:hypothetical protein
MLVSIVAMSLGLGEEWVRAGLGDAQVIVGEGRDKGKAFDAPRNAPGVANDKVIGSPADYTHDMVEGNRWRMELFVNAFLIVFEFICSFDGTGNGASFEDFLFDLVEVIWRDFVVRGDVDEFGRRDRGTLAIVATFVAGLTRCGLTFVEVTGFWWDAVFEGVLINM